MIKESCSHGIFKMCCSRQKDTRQNEYCEFGNFSHIQNNKYQMLGLIRMIRFTRGYTLTPNSTPHWHKLQQHFLSQPNSKQRIDYLRGLTQSELNDYYSNKTYSILSQEEIFALFTVKHQPSVVAINFSRQASVLQQVKWDFFRCYLVKEFGWLREQSQYLIVLGLNQRLAEMPLEELVFCLEVVSNFYPEIIEELNTDTIIDRIRKEAAKHDPHTANNLLKLTCHLGELDVELGSAVGTQEISNWLKINPILDLHAIYAIHTLHFLLKIPLLTPLKQVLGQALAHTLEQAPVDQINSDYLAFMLEEYPQCLPLIRVNQFQGRAYISFLLFHILHPETNLKPHPIPYKMYLLSSSIIYKMLSYRHSLGLDSPQSLAQSVLGMMQYKLSGVQALLSHLHDHKIKNTTVEALIEKELVKVLQLRKGFTPQIEEKYANSGIISTLSTMCKCKKGSLDFWKRASRCLEKMVETNSIQHPIIYPSPQSYCNLLYICVSKSAPWSLTQAVLNFIRHSLTHQQMEWSIKNMSTVAMVLTKGRIGEEDIWLLLDWMVRKYPINKKLLILPKHQKTLKQLGGSFMVMRKGTPQLWKFLNETMLDEYKQKLLALPQSPQSQIKTYICLNSTQPLLENHSI